MRSLDGREWQTVSYNTPTNVLLSLRNGALLRVTNNDGATTVYQSEDEGQSWTRAVRQDTGEPFEFLTSDAWLVRWGAHQAQSGVIILAEYCLPGDCGYLYRSDDGGLSWQVVYNAAGTIRHFHAVTKHEGLGRWIISTGDGNHRQTVLASDDDGLTWWPYVELGELYLQPTAWLDVGDPTRLFFGSDLNWQAGWFDVSDQPTAKRLFSAITNWDSRSGAGYSFCMFKHDGVYYACQFDNRNAWEKQPVVSVSRDLRHWAVYHQFQNWERGIRDYAGYGGGRLHGTLSMSTVLRPFRMLPADLTLVEGLSVSPSSTNLVPPSNSAGDIEQHWQIIEPAGAGSPGELGFDPTLAYYGPGSVRAARNDGMTLVVHGPAIQTQAGKSYHGRFWIRGKAGNAGVRWRFNYADVGDTAHYGAGDEWTPVTIPPYVAPSNGILRPQFIIGSTQWNDTAVNIDSVQVSEQSLAAWTPPGQPSTPAVIEANFDVGPFWTNVFTFIPDLSSLHQSKDGRLHVRTWRFMDSELILSYLGYQRQFELQLMENGAPSGNERTSPHYFAASGQFRFALQSGKGCHVLWFANGGTLERIKIHGDILSGSAVSVDMYAPYGIQMPGTLAMDSVYSGFLNSAAVEAAMNEIYPPSGAGDLNGDQRVDLQDLLAILGDFGAGASGASLDDLLDVLANIGVIYP